MKAQTKKASLLEAVVNILVGVGLAFTSQLVIFHAMGIRVEYYQNVIMTAFFTVISLVRSFVLRRIFNWFTEHSFNFNEKKEIQSQ